MGQCEGEEGFQQTEHQGRAAIVQKSMLRGQEAWWAESERGCKNKRKPR